MSNHEKEFLGKTVLLTGGGRGIGLSIANRFAEVGAYVIIADINRDRGSLATQTLNTSGYKCEFIQIDLSAPGAGAELIERAATVTGTIDLLVNNARSGRRVKFDNETEENWSLTINVGLKAAFFASIHVIKLMADKGGCSIVNIGSVAGQQVTIESPAYHAAKAGLMHLTKYLAVNGGPQKARVNCVVPGLIVQQEHRQRFDSKENISYREKALFYQPLGEVGSEMDVTEAVMFLSSERARYVSGVCLTLDGSATLQEPFGLLLKAQPS